MTWSHEGCLRHGFGVDARRRRYVVPVGFQDVGPQWNRDEPWQTQQSKIVIRGLTDSSPWMAHQRRLLFGLLLGLAALIVLVTAVSVLLS